MPKNICLIYVETNGVHKTDEIVSKKNMLEKWKELGLHLAGDDDNN